MRSRYTLSPISAPVVQFSREGETVVWCVAELSTDRENACWVKRAEFMACVDRSGFPIIVQDAYSTQWFHQTKRGVVAFYLPTFYFQNGRVIPVDGRHRIVLLSRFLKDFLPMGMQRIEPSGLLGKDAPLDAKSEIAFKNIVHRQLPLDEVFELPDLPTNRAFREE